MSALASIALLDDKQTKPCKHSYKHFKTKYTETVIEHLNRVETKELRNNFNT